MGTDRSFLFGFSSSCVCVCVSFITVKIGFIGKSSGMLIFIPQGFLISSTIPLSCISEPKNR